MMAFRTLRILALLFGMFLAGDAFLYAATQYDIKQMTPEVEAALSNRKARYEQIMSMKSEGALGENNQGYIEARVDSAAAREIAEIENRDRQTIYRTIAEQNNLGAAGLAVVETVFAEVQQEKARPGDPIQLAAGQWVKK